MAETTDTEVQAPLSAAGHFRVVYWFSAWVVIFSLFFFYRLDALKPDWLVLAALALLPVVLSIRSYNDLLRLRAATSKERTAQIALAVGAALVCMALFYLAWRYSPAFAIRMIDAYVMPALLPTCIVLVMAAFHVERKQKVRVFVGNQGWLFLPLPSNSTVERDARKSGARPSL